MQKTGVVVTTIGKGDFLDDFTRQIDEENAKDQVSIYVIPDLKTPIDLWQKCNEKQEEGFSIKFVEMMRQETILSYVGLAGLVPYNSDNRRNIGYLLALEDECEVIISMDDDNYPRTGTKFYAEHGTVGQELNIRTRDVRSKWYNVLGDLGLPHTYPRGFPYRHRDEGFGFKETQDRSKVMMNVGLWLGDPDLDAITWVTGGAKALQHRSKPYVLGNDTWTPVSSQNTAVHRLVMPSYYFLPMNTTVRGLEMDRYGDIFSGYFAQACVKHMGHGVRVGPPVVDHRRNSHQHWDDVRKELVCIGMVDDLMDWLTEAKLEGSTYRDAYLSLADKMEDAVETFTGGVWTVDAKAYFHRAAYCMRRWVKACETVTQPRKEEAYASVSGN